MSSSLFSVISSRFSKVLLFLFVTTLNSPNLYATWLIYVYHLRSNYKNCLEFPFKGEASLWAFMQIGGMENYFRDLSAKDWANFDNPIKSYDSSNFWLMFCMPPSQVALCCNLWCDNSTLLSNGTAHKFHHILLYCLMELHTNFTTFYFWWKCIFPLLLYLGMLSLNMLGHAFFIGLDQPDYWYQRRKKLWKSMY